MSLNLEEAVEAGSGALGRNYCCRQCKNPIVLSPDLENLNNAEIESMFSKFTLLVLGIPHAPTRPYLIRLGIRGRGDWC